MKKLSVLIILIIIFLAIMIKEAYNGNSAAIAALSSLVTVFLVLIGAGIASFNNWLSGKNDETRMKQSQTEYIKMIQQIAQIQNMQLKNQKLLPTSDNVNNNDIVIDDAIFELLD